jgi:hypothetical protein
VGCARPGGALVADLAVTNEMLGNGVLPAAEDDGNLIVISGSIVSAS